MSYRRPGQKWCTDTAVRLIHIAAREPFREAPLVTAEDANTLLKAAAIIDVFGQRAALERERASA
jgi:hypothetical protein